MSALLLSDELMFNSRITGTGRDLGFAIVPTRSATALLDLARRTPPTCVIVDLANAGLDISALIVGLSDLPQRPRIVAYGSHVDTASLNAARTAGCDLVLPRSKFVEELPKALAQWMEAKA